MSGTANPPDRRAFLESMPSPDGLRRLSETLAEVLGPDEITGVVRLGGGLDCATHRFTSGDRRLVLKRYLPGDTNAANEHRNLRCAHRAAVPTPEPIALDEAGAWFGTQALAMTFIDGQMNLLPADDGLWLAELARALAAVHDAPVGDLQPAPTTYWSRWKPWTDVETEPMMPAIVDAVAALREIAGDQPHVLSHDDFHPGNLVWRGDRVAGVVDWAYASLAPREAAVAGCRKDLAIHPGGDAPERFLRCYEAETGIRLEHIGVWDVLYGAMAMEWGRLWAPSFAEAGVHLSGDEIHRRSAAFVDQALTARRTRS